MSRESVRERLRANPPGFARGDRVNVDGLGTDLEVMSVKLGAQDWNVEVRFDDGRVFNAPASNVWRS
jgi:hypothetical protein